MHEGLSSATWREKEVIQSKSLAFCGSYMVVLTLAGGIFQAIA